MVWSPTRKLPESMEAFAAMLSKSAYAAQTFTGPGPSGATGPGAENTLQAVMRSSPLRTGTVLKEILP